MKTLFVGINAKFIHSNLAIRYIQKYAEGQGIVIETSEYTINQSIDLIFDGILCQSPDLVGFSCYLWNIEMIKKLVVMLKQVKPDMKVLLGGPEVSYDTKDIMLELPEVDYIISGEGERSATALVRQLSVSDAVEGLTGLTYRRGNLLCVSPPTMAMDLSEVPFVYEKGLTGLEHRILYYETSRGCPYKCQYCLSSIEKEVRFRPFNMIKEELQFFLDQEVSQVKFVDRTFNAKISHTLAIWEYLHENDNGVTNFHFEITADLLDTSTIDFLVGVRPGLFQFEVGVQSTHEATILTVERKVEFPKLKERVLKVMAGNNIHMHLDLIAGLPKEDYLSFKQSFNDVMAMKPEQLQLGFLKVLKGSKIHTLQKHYGIVYRQFAPYEVLFTGEMSYEDLKKLKDIEALLETYYNSNQFTSGINYLMASHSSDFDCFEKMAEHWRNEGYYLLPHNRIRLYELLYEYALSCPTVDIKFFAELLKHDLCMREKPKKWPEFIQPEDGYARETRDFYQREDLNDTLFEAYKGYTSKQISRMAHLERYNYDIQGDGRLRDIWLFYDYRHKNIMSGQALVTEIEMKS